MSDGPLGITFQSAGCKLLGALYLGVGDGPRPTALVLHGIPGVEKNTDIAYALRDAGWNALIFHYRGSWGSEGEYTLAGTLDDVRAAIDELVSGRHPVDPRRLAVVGHSLGGWAAVVSAARDNRIKAAVTIGGVSNMRAWHVPEATWLAWADFLNNTSGAELMSQYRALGQTRNPVDVIGDLGSTSVLIVHGDADEVVPVEQARALYRSSSGLDDLVIIAGADHAFNRHRRQMVETVVNWLMRTVK
jgi:hypothetical protein